jgi:ParB-like chromosome segregation protein Spo0J
MRTQSLTVRPVLDESGAETGMYEVPAGGRRYRALELLVKPKRLARTAAVPCIVRTGGIAEEDSLAENVQRAPLLGCPSINFAHSSHCAKRANPRKRSPCALPSLDTCLRTVCFIRSADPQ